MWGEEIKPVLIIDPYSRKQLAECVFAPYFRGRTYTVNGSTLIVSPLPPQGRVLMINNNFEAK